MLKPFIQYAMEKEGEKYGVKVSDFSVDLKKIKERKDSILLDMRKGLKEWMISLEKLHSH